MAIRINVPAPLPAQVTGDGGIAVSKRSGIWTIEPDWGALTILTALADPASKHLWVLDPATGDYYRLSIKVIIDALPAGPPGSTGPVPWSAPAAWLTATNYVAGPPASAVTQGGETYVCLVTHTSGTFATDLAAGKWIKVASKGADGALAASGTPTAGQLGVWTNSTTQKGVSITGLVKGNGAGDPTAAVAGTDYCAAAPGSSVLKGSSGNAVEATAGTDFMKPDTTSNLTAGFTATSYNAGTKSSGTFTPDPTLGQIQHYTNGGAHTLAPPSNPCSMVIECTNSSAGALTTSGFSVVSGDTYSSSGTKKHIFKIIKTNSYSQLDITYVTGT